MSVTLTISVKGQLTLNRDMLKHLGIGPGEKVLIAKLPGGAITLSAAPKGNIAEAFGLLKRKDGPVLSIAQIKAATIRGWAGSGSSTKRKGERK